jgi:hypothetical protein
MVHVEDGDVDGVPVGGRMDPRFLDSDILVEPWPLMSGTPVETRVLAVQRAEPAIEGHSELCHFPTGAGTRRELAAARRDGRTTGPAEPYELLT